MIVSPTDVKFILLAFFVTFMPGVRVNVTVSSALVSGMDWSAVTVTMFLIIEAASISICVTLYVFVNVLLWPTSSVTFSATTPSLSSATFTFVSVTLPVFVTTYVYVTLPGLFSVSGLAVFDTSANGVRVPVIFNSATLSEMSGCDTFTLFLTYPASTSDCFTVYVYVYSHVSPTSSFPLSSTDSSRIVATSGTRLSVTTTFSSVTLPVFFTLTV